MAILSRDAPVFRDGCRRRRSVRLAAVLWTLVGGAALAGEPGPGSGTWKFEVELRLFGEAGGSTAVGRCVARLSTMDESMGLRCVHDLAGVAGVTLASRGDLAGVRLGSAASPIELRAKLAPEWRARLLAGGLDLVLDGPSSWPGVVVGELVDPIFVSGFEIDGLCEWTNFLAACVDGNVCTDDVCAGADGSCSHPDNTDFCDLPNATGTCGEGSCGLDACLFGYSNCDANGENGCEVSHGTASNVCAAATDVGTADGDVNCGFICGANGSWTLFATQTGQNSRWYRSRVREDSNCAAAIEHRIRLVVPPGVDYDLFAYKPCGEAAIASSTGGTGIDESIVVQALDSVEADDSFDYWIEVRFVSGASCESYTLWFEGHTC